jgi:hypothetical protein
LPTAPFVLRSCWQILALYALQLFAGLAALTIEQLVWLKSSMQLNISASVNKVRCRL